MGNEKGRSLSLSLPRRWMGDMLHFAKSVPTVAGERTLRVRNLVEARRSVPHAPGWYIATVKAMGIVSQRLPELRRAYLPFPWPRLYEHPYSVAATVVNRTWEGEEALFLCPLLHPERVSLPQLQTKYNSLRTDPVERHGSMRRLLRISRLPWPIRRLGWSVGLNLSGFYRARTFGTFAVNSIAGMRGRMLQFLTPITTMLYIGAPRGGELDVQFAFDHRVYDGVTAARCVQELEHVLNEEIAAEYRGLADQSRAAA